MILQEMGSGHGLDRSGSRQGYVAGSCECGNEPLGSIKCGEFHECLRAWTLLRGVSLKLH